MKILFAGTPEIGVPLLCALHSSPEHEVVAVVTNCDAPKGRSKQPVPSPVKEAAFELGIPVLHDMPVHFGRGIDGESVSNAENATGTTAEVGVIVAYGKILPAKVLEAMPRGFINLHFSLLPAYRGAAPVQRAIENGENTTGVTVFHLLEGLDDGPIYTQQQFDILESETSGELLERLSVDGIPAVLEALEMVQQNIKPTPQLSISQKNATGITYAAKLLKSQARINWASTHKEIVHHINAFSPNPGAYFEIQVGSKPPVRVIALKAKIASTNGNAEPQVWDQFHGVELLQVKPAGKNAMPAKDWLNGLKNTEFTVV